MKVETNNDVFPPRKHFVEVEDKFKNFTKDCRVLPVTYFEEPNTIFFLKAKYEPGEKKTFPNGGYELYSVEGATHNFELDQCVVHPYQLGMTQYFSKMENVVKEKVTTGPKGKRGRPRLNPDELKTFAPYIPKGTPRGRRKLSDEERALREASKPVKTTGGKRGRAPLPPEVKAAREAERAAKKAQGPGRRGRPAKKK